MAGPNLYELKEKLEALKKSILELDKEMEYARDWYKYQNSDTDSSSFMMISAWDSVKEIDHCIYGVDELIDNEDDQ